MPLSIFLQVLVGGVVLGAIYALVAFGLSLIYGVVRILNFSHGTILAVSAIAGCVLFTAFGIHPALIAAALVPLAALFGYGFYVLLLDPLFRRPPAETMVGTVLVTVGALLILSDVAAALAGTSLRTIQFASPVFFVGGVMLSTTTMTVIAGIIALVLALHL